MQGQRRSSAEWEQLLSEFDAGSESAAEFCKRKDLKSSNFYKRLTARIAASSFAVARRAAPPASLSVSAP